MIRFWTSGTSAAPDLDAEVAARDHDRVRLARGSSSSASTASAFSIFAITCAVRAGLLDQRRAGRARRRRSGRTRARRSRRRARARSSRSSMSLRVSDGIGTGTPGRFTPLWELTTPPMTTAQRARPRSTVSTRSRTSPSSISTSWPGCSTSPITVGLDRQLAVAARLLRRDDDLLAALERDGLGEVADPQLRPLQVGDQRDRPPELLLRLRGRPAPAPRAPRASRARSSGGAASIPPASELGRATSGDRRGGTDAWRRSWSGAHGRPLRSGVRSHDRPETVSVALGAWKRVPARVDGPVAELLLDPQQLVVLRHAVARATGAPVLIWPAFVATARSAIVVSSVSPERCDMTTA